MEQTVFPPHGFGHLGTSVVHVDDALHLPSIRASSLKEKKRSACLSFGYFSFSSSPSK